MFATYYKCYIIKWVLIWKRRMFNLSYVLWSSSQRDLIRPIFTVLLTHLVSVLTFLEIMCCYNSISLSLTLCLLFSPVLSSPWSTQSVCWGFPGSPWFVCMSKACCYWSWLGRTGGDSGLPLTHISPPISQLIRGSRFLLLASWRARLRFLIVRLDWEGEGKLNSLQVCPKSLTGLDFFSGLVTVKTSPPMHSLLLQGVCGSQATLVFKVKLLCIEFLSRWLVCVYELLIGVLFIFVTAYEAFKKRHSQEGVEEHDDHDIKVSVVVRLPGAGGHSTPAEVRTHCAVGISGVGGPSTDVLRVVLQNLLASGE